MPDDRFLRVRNFEKFQSFNSKNLKQAPHPTWIKLWFALLQDRTFYRLPDSLKFHVVGMFLIASQNNNRIPNDPEWLRHQMGASEKINVPALLESKFIEWADGAVENAKKALDGVSSLESRESILGEHQRREEKKRHMAKRAVSPHVYTQEFEQFWEGSSKRGSKYEAFEVWQRLSGDDRRLATAAMCDACGTEWKSMDWQFIPHVRRWLRGRGWESQSATKKRRSGVIL